MALSSDTEALDLLEQLPRAPAADVKKLGWRGVMKTVRRSGRLVVTNHDEPEAVILTADEYADLIRAAQQAPARTEAALAELRQRFDQRLAALQAQDAGDRLRKVMRAGAKLEGKVKAGASH
ncbi:MAG: type II toxin-antitoxin system Phd/YefM family antitoxin [Burkholderiaceae bacterium]|nr:type II toxin-antitoxin system Phd/YefM family antitoxin [Burkholderiaceae bacterium]